MSNFTSRRVALFRRTVLAYYRLHKRDLPWRKTKDPYHILVSEVMLQQTQAQRVVGKYREFITRFPTVSTLATAPFAEVLRKWQGLGYNRRALYLHKTAKIITTEYGGVIPHDPALLEALPGIGHYTACAISAFAFNKPYPFIETNIRSVYLHHFFPTREKVSDKELLPLIERTLPLKNPRDWYAALMDYGAYLKAQGENPSRRSAHHTHQKPFKGSDRELRGALLRALSKGSHTYAALSQAVPFTEVRIKTNLSALVREGLVNKKRSTYAISA